jgi:hypothetical protein
MPLFFAGPLCAAKCPRVSALRTPVGTWRGCLRDVHGEALWTCEGDHVHRESARRCARRELHRRAQRHWRRRVRALLAPLIRKEA